MTAWGKPFWHAWLTGIAMALAGFALAIFIDQIADKHKKKKALRLLQQHKRAQTKTNYSYCTTGGAKR